MQREIHGVFVRGGAENPVALFSDPRVARTWMLENHGANAVVVPLEASITASSLADAEEVVAGSFPEAPAAPVVDPEKERIRAAVVQERREQALRAEVEHELDQAERDQAKADRPAAATAASGGATTSASGAATTAGARAETRASGRG